MFFWWSFPAALAEPWVDPATAALREEVRAQGVDRFGGIDDLSARASLLLPLPAELPAAVETLWGPELEYPGSGARGLWIVRPEARVAVGNEEPEGQDGDAEPGMVSPQVGARGALFVGPWTLRAAPQVGLEVAPGVAPSLRLPELWTGVEMKGFVAGFGKTRRWVGPGRHANLMLGDNAAPPWLGSVAGEGRFPGAARWLGRFRGELALGVLDAPREDVDHPGLLLLDLRWKPAPVLEVGATRMSIFGGAGRPPVDFGQLLLPTEPHIYDDPDQELPDQDELASLDFRVSLPLEAWTGGPVRYVEAWWEYGGEDVIARETAGIELPSLAGVGNLIGGEVAVGPIVASGEFTQLMDDYFRWYVGHRVYHDGFTQDDRSMGHPIGGDGQDLWGAVAVDVGRWRGRVSLERMVRVGVVEARGDNLFALGTEEHRQRVGLDLGRRDDVGGYLSAGVGLERYRGDDFVPGADGWRFRVAVTAAPALTRSGWIGQPTAPPLPPPVPPPLPVGIGPADGPG